MGRPSHALFQQHDNMSGTQVAKLHVMQFPRASCCFLSTQVQIMSSATGQPCLLVNIPAGSNAVAIAIRSENKALIQQDTAALQSSWLQEAALHVRKLTCTAARCLSASDKMYTQQRLLFLFSCFLVEHQLCWQRGESRITLRAPSFNYCPLCTTE